MRELFPHSGPRVQSFRIHKHRIAKVKVKVKVKALRGRVWPGGSPAGARKLRHKRVYLMRLLTVEHDRTNILSTSP